jgi:Holliday junction resolvase RusA-like endonuclease
LIRLIINGEPLPQPRHRSVPRFRGKGEAKKVYVAQIPAEDGHSIWTWRDKIRQEIARLALPAQFLNPAIAYELVMPRPKTAKLEGVERERVVGAKRGAWQTAAPTYCGGKGDMDNLLKPFMDVGNDDRIWPDDGRVWYVVGGMKRVASGDTRDPPRADVTIWDASELTLVTAMQWHIDHWPAEWDERTAFVRREK